MRLIDADALRKLYSGWIPQLKLPEDERDKEAIETCIAVMDDAPTIEAYTEEQAVRHGEWRRGYKRSNSYMVEVECSQCDAMFEISEFSLGLNYNYCPHCGAKMDGGADNAVH